MKYITNQKIIYTTTYYIGLDLAETDVGKKLDITNPVAEFKRQCVESGVFVSDLNSLRTTHTRSYDLPLDCFESGEKRPEKLKKTKKTKNGTNGTPASNGSTPRHAPSAPESRKRGAAEALPSTLSKKQILENTSDVTNGVKRVLEQEVRVP